MDYENFHHWVFKELGLSLNSYKQTQLNRRINSLMDRKGIKTLEEYMAILQKSKFEQEQFIEFVTINVTEFFRNQSLFLALKDFLELYIKDKKSLKIWSAGSSIGAEAYTLAMILEELNCTIPYRIIGSDIDSKVLEKASMGIYNKNDIATVDKSYIDKYFKISNEQYEILPTIKSKVSFKRHDLIIDNYEKEFDLILCRNVTIYFKDKVRDNIIKNLSLSLKKEGIIFVGATESIHNFRELDLIRLAPFIYQKL